ncbi:MAG: DNA-3-methyladenine glycosylase I [Desulfamplus sp.]|nr:DNA-3-methyladenine glycosylase I [Desulfamplus sp.]
MQRCHWVGNDPSMMEYHDREWGVPLHDDTKLFEFLTLEGAQAGLSWSTILHKRDNYRKAFDHFDIQKVARYTSNDLERLMENPGIVRNRSKIISAVENAGKIIEIQREYGSFDAFIWYFAKETPIPDAMENKTVPPSQSHESVIMSRELKKRGFKFVGPVICYSFMQAVGMVNDHITTCFRYKELLKVPDNS